MTGGTKGNTTARRRGRPIEVWVNDEEKATITARAKEAGLARSAYLRALGLNTPLKSVVHLGAVTDLVKVNGDLGRVAGLLKLWLAERRGEGANAVDVESVMMEFRRLQVAIGMKMGEIVKTHN
ncbi:plasmid mobilization protein [Pseudomonas sp. CDFA 610]|uniref:plasmid mobilization protein n=1 Tax=Pseudomonas sp. CDFA 610 TaxID=2829825 RepID=UPI001E29D7CB|nr:CopG family transcriptional regulator [Pseudomonas sp. CDFA 610]MCD5982358.1 CopG family transcriptional regulator [Pseudomonas sp. CDFA 610]